VFLWLDVDSELRAHSGGKATLDDFTHRFFSGSDGKPGRPMGQPGRPMGQPEVKPYVETDLYTALAAIAPADWHAIVHKHLDVPNTNALLEALKHSGWQLSYSPQKNVYVELTQKIRKVTNRVWSIGLRVNDKGMITDVIEGRAAALAGVGPEMTLVAVNGKKYTPEILDAALVEAQSSHKPIDLLVENDDYYRTVSVPYFDGPRFPHLERVEGTPDTLSEVLKPHAQH
jgi:predicted metalloprotease with PDZ domain